MALGIVDLRRAGQRLLGGFDAGESKVKIIGDIEEAVGGGEDGGIVVLLRLKMIDRVDRHELDARLTINLGEGEFLKETRGTVGGAGVAVTIGIAERVAIGVEQHVIDSPRIGANAGNRQVARSGLLDSGKDLLFQVGQVPMQMAFDR